MSTNKQKHIYFLGIGGTLMGSLAQLAQQKGFKVSGSDKKLYPPMSDQLANANIEVFEGFDESQLDPEPDLVVIGNAGLPRGHEGVECVLDKGIPYTSGAQWLGEDILQGRWVIAVSGTHGKTTTASMVAWILEYAGLKPGYLIGGAPHNFSQSAQLGDGPFFVVEADEYDTSYFDRRSKFVHYRPRTLIINNLEYDHADIFSSIEDIQRQFHNLLRTVPKNGLVIAPTNNDHVNAVLHKGLWTPLTRVGKNAPKKLLDMETNEHWSSQPSNTKAFDVLLNNHSQGTVNWALFGSHNQSNALNAIAAARHAGVPVGTCVEALSEFSGVKRRLEVIFESPAITVYDDFAHHPTAIRSTLEALRKAVGPDEIVAIVEPRTHTMSLGTLRHDLTTCCAAADQVIWFRGENIKWDLMEVVQNCVVNSKLQDNHDNLISHLVVNAAEKAANHKETKRRTHYIIMSNGAFGGIYQTLVEQLKNNLGDAP